MNDTPPAADDFGWYSAFSSSWIAAFHYDGVTQRLWMKTKAGKAYLFSGFPLGKWKALKAAPSKGKFFDQHLKGSYKAR